ncbi:aldehyde dehydrogenase family protein [Bacillus lacus]|uniref:Aldehyde dehydrogenase n=1 Tax=Metabacillus lacus TaxID=1983721 RepID=A0A7X2LZC9_9BACI|nr:aldehyde dehydrogenase family protein [Metabacillus lacus]MRX73281.1 aldehyde dehydrogenase family protein [Metabacillus lacus]
MTDRKTISAINPATGQIIREIEETQLERIPGIYEDSRAAFKSWSALTVKERLRYFKKLRHLMAEKIDAITEIISSDTGKVRMEAAVADVMPVLDAILHMEKHAEKILGRQKMSTPILFFGKKSYVEYMARGSVLVISPWNYPLQLAMVPMLSALAGGNTVVLKPSEVTPLVGQLVEALFKEAGFPEHVVQVAHGGKEVGAELTKHRPDYIFFTGSVRTGKIIQEIAAKDLIPTTLELGGKDPMIVFSDANIDRAVKGAVWGSFTNSGQVCMSAERLYVQRPIFERFVAKMRDEVRMLSQGSGMNHDIGSMTYPEQITVVREQVLDALEKGAKLVTGEHPDKWDTEKGLFIEPIILTEVTDDMKIVHEESFGPIIPVIPFDTEEEAVELANGTIYGLNASVFSRDIAKAERVVSKLVTGNAVVNDVMVSVVNHGLPFGGAKQSGLGSYHGDGGLRMFCQEKAVMTDSGKKDTEIQWYPYKGKYQQFSSLFQQMFGKQKNLAESAKVYRELARLSKEDSK